MSSVYDLLLLELSRWFNAAEDLSLFPRSHDGRGAIMQCCPDYGMHARTDTHDTIIKGTAAPGAGEMSQ